MLTAIGGAIRRVQLGKHTPPRLHNGTGSTKKSEGCRTS